MARRGLRSANEGRFYNCHQHTLKDVIMKMLRLIMTIILITLLFCNGCYNRVEIDNSIAVVAHGLDISADGKRLVSTAQLALPSQAQAEQEAPKFMLRSAQAPSFTMADQEIAYTLPRQLVWSMVETYIVGETIARQDITLILDHLARTRTVREGSMLFLAYNSTPHEVLSTETPPEDYSGPALAKMIRAQEEQTGLYSPVTIQEFLQKVSRPGIEPVLPQVMIESMEGRAKLKISGLAVFQGHRMVGSLNEQESRGFHFMKSSARGGLFVVNLPGEAGQSRHTLELIQSQATIEPIIKQGQIIMKIAVKADGNLYELHSSDSIIDLEQMDLLEEAAIMAIRSDVEACIHKARGFQSDILGWGLTIHSKDRALWGTLAEDWPAQFAALPYEIEVDYKLRRTYLTGKALEEH